MPSKVLANVVRTADNLQVLRDILGESITINSAYRCKTHNLASGGVKSSQHILGIATDLATNNPESLYDTIENLINKGVLKEGGLGIYNTFVHYDTRGNKARWDYRKD
tara:strand:- start:842 stop:1165 length:324 start_codon:yes stop_codon:yes gene_type:complete